MRGNRYKYGSLEEGLSTIALNRQAEIEFLKTKVLVNAIITGCSSVMSAVSGGAATNSDALDKSLDALKELLLPHYAEERERKVQSVRAKLIKETSGAPLKYKIVEQPKKKRSNFVRR